MSLSCLAWASTSASSREARIIVRARQATTAARAAARRSAKKSLPVSLRVRKPT
jgi:hypothetical protein